MKNEYFMSLRKTYAAFFVIFFYFQVKDECVLTLPQDVKQCDSKSLKIPTQLEFYLGKFSQIIGQA